ncbi:hypothetical protein ACEQ8H_005888 [Pleosporales sp. CAS-2024a]
MTPLGMPRLLSRRAFSTTRTRHTSFKAGPSPRRLPKPEQEVFEQLQKQSTGAFSTPRAPTATHTQEAQPTKQQRAPEEAGDDVLQILMEHGKEWIGRGEEEEGQVHPNRRRGAPPEFEGDVNPKTGEVGGPKNDPLRWKGEWSFNGRVTDF